MKYKDLREFIQILEQQGKLKRITAPVSPYLEITEISDRVLRAGGAALLFENVVKADGANIPTRFGKFVWHHRARCHGHGRKRHQPITRNRQNLGIFERTRAAQRRERRIQQIALAQDIWSMAPNIVKMPLPRNCFRRGKCEFIRFADSALLGGRCCAIGNVGLDRNARLQ